MDNLELLNNLIKAESTKEVVKVLKNFNLLKYDPKNWLPLGDNFNNKPLIMSQTSRPEHAIVEKLTNSVDALIQLKVIEDDGNSPPLSVKDAVEKYFGIPEGNLIYTTQNERTPLVENIQLFSTGKKKETCIFIADQGMGQPPEKFKDTLLSINKSNKVNLPYLTGSYNMGGTASLSFSGDLEMNLIISKMAPSINKNNSKDWGFTLIKRFEGEEIGGEEAAYFYLNSSGNILTTNENSLKILPEKVNDIFKPYCGDISHGTIIKMYSYNPLEWKSLGKQLFNRRPRIDLESIYSSIPLPAKIVDARSDIKAKSHNVITGYWTRNKDNFHDQVMDLQKEGPYGTLNFKLSVFNMEKLPRNNKGEPDTETLSGGIHLLMNGQSQFSLNTSFITHPKQLGLRYLKDLLRVDVDFFEVDKFYRDKIFKASRDDVKNTNQYIEIRNDIIDYLKNLDYLKDLNAYYESKGGEAQQKEIDKLLDKYILGIEHIKALLTGKNPNIKKRMPSKELQDHSYLKNNPSFFYWKNEKLIQEKNVPQNTEIHRTFMITDVVNEYFNRLYDPGSISIDGSFEIVERSLINGKLNLGILLPKNIKVGDRFEMKFQIKDTASSNFELINNIIIVDPVVKNNSKSIKNPNRKESKSGDFPEDGGLPIAIKGDAEHFSKMFTDFTIEDSVWCVGEKWYLNTDNKYYKDFARSKEFANVPSNFIEAQFEKSLILLGISLKSNNVDEDEIKNILRGQAQVSVPIIYALEYKKNK